MFEYVCICLLCTQKTCVTFKKVGYLQHQLKFVALNFYKMLSEKILNSDRRRVSLDFKLRPNKSWSFFLDIEVFV